MPNFLHLVRDGARFSATEIGAHLPPRIPTDKTMLCSDTDLGDLVAMCGA